MKTKVRLMIVCFLMIVSFAGCSEAEKSHEENIKQDEKKTVIGMSFDSFVIERWQRDRDVFVSTAKEYGAEVNVQTANGEVEEQIKQIEYFIKKQVDAIVIVAIDADKLTDVVIRAKKAGIPVICYDRLVRNADADLYISFDNEEVGAKMAAALFLQAGTGANVIKVCGPDSDYNVSMVDEGFMRVCDAYRGKVIGSVNCENWRAEEAYSYISDNIELVKQADAIMCGNDSLAGEVIRALAERRLAGSIPVVGQDADLEACQRIIEGTQLMTVYKPVEKLAKAAAEYTVALAMGEKPDNQNEFFDGTYQIPYVKLKPIHVNKENIDQEIIDTGFHIKEDIYLNMNK